MHDDKTTVIDEGIIKFDAVSRFENCDLKAKLITQVFVLESNDLRDCTKMNSLMETDCDFMLKAEG